MAALEDAVNLPLFGLFLFILLLLCFDAFSAVTVQYALNYSRHSINKIENTSPDLYNTRQSRSQRHFCLLCVFEFPFIVKLDMRILMKYSQDVLFCRYIPHDCNTKYIHNHCPVTITTIWECNVYQRSSPSWIKNVTWNAYTTYIYYFGIYCLIYINHFLFYPDL